MVNPFVKDFAVHNVGLSKWQPALILSICSGIDIISRPLGGYICSSKFIREKLGTFETFTISVIGLGLVNLFAPFYVFNFASFAVYGVLFGLCFGYVLTVFWSGGKVYGPDLKVYISIPYSFRKTTVYFPALIYGTAAWVLFPGYVGDF